MTNSFGTSRLLQPYPDMQLQNRSTLALALLVAGSAGAGAQVPVRAPDSTLIVRNTVVVEKTAGRSAFVSFLRKLTLRSDEVALDTTGAPIDSAYIHEVAAVEAPTAPFAFKSLKDSVAWDRARTVADNSDGYRIVVDIFEKRLFVIDGKDTLRRASVATAKNESLEYGDKIWHFVTPRGVLTVIKKEKDPVWNPPEWHFAEVASENGLKLHQLVRGRTILLKNGSKLLTQGDEVGIIEPGSTDFHPMVLDEHIVFDNTLFIPPEGTKNHVIQGELGHFRLNLGEGYGLHGTPFIKSIGASVTHGCIRLLDPDIEWLYENVPVGTKVYIY